ncbi:uncharacterized protein SAPINGB_P001156 [Magnusiomyces paraingens]|uniref:Endoplasmic reticulum transmembrane protein n=1 Tax=Magnusiomyces paraingens TaxID=2606893 RepID=A0A5E8BAK6_9ASCO|nr:uncharacterized protein SAPINGB_P001156 [Saprochaete ingens]VVT46322.1 unnamed protein product [Saprochaete ingens]
MTLYYTLVFVLLVAEMFSFFVLVAPLPNAARRKLLTFLAESPLIKSVQTSLKFTFVAILILFVDSVNRVYRVQTELAAAHESVVGSMGAMTDRSEIQARRFYAQRNMYLCGFTLFLSLILTRTYTLVLDLTIAKDKLTTSDGDSAQVQKLKQILAQKEKDIEALKKQSQGLSKEYFKVSDELNEKTGVTSADKKLD